MCACWVTTSELQGARRMGEMPWGKIDSESILCADTDLMLDFAEYLVIMDVKSWLDCIDLLYCSHHHCTLCNFSSARHPWVLTRLDSFSSQLQFLLAVNPSCESRPGKGRWLLVQVVRENTFPASREHMHTSYWRCLLSPPTCLPNLATFLPFLCKYSALYALPHYLLSQSACHLWL